MGRGATHPQDLCRGMVLSAVFNLTNQKAGYNTHRYFVVLEYIYA